MSPPPSTTSELPVAPPAAALAATQPTRPLYWSLRRELWENRSIYVAPLAVAAVVLFGFLISTFTLPRRMHAALALAPAKQYAAVVMPYDTIAGLTLVTAFVVGVFYCLDALYGERRDRSILFWKSLPVSDRTAVLAKAAIPLVVLPLLVFAIVVVTQLIMLLMSTVVLGGGASAEMLWARLPIFQLSLAFFYALIAIALWHAPVYGWLLLVSAWARRAAFLWAVLPFFAIAVFEGIAFRTSHFASWVGYRLIGWFQLAFIAQHPGSASTDPLTEITPGRFLGTPGLWLGLAFAAGFLAAAVRLRRYREPI